MTTEQRPSRSGRKTPRLTNQTLLIMIGVLSAVLVLLLVLGICLPTGTPQETNPPVIGSQGTENTTPSTEATEATTPTDASTEPTTEPTQPPAPTLPVTPEGENYEDVGSGYIAEIILVNAETFNGKTNDDYSCPTNNYLPKGTVDYCAAEPVYSNNGNLSYVQLRSGHRVYVERKIYPPVQYVEVTNRYEGTLPDHNEISVASFQDLGRHTVLTLDCLWKAPFYFDLAPQSYANPDGGSDRDFSVTSFTAKYVDITFCYATAFTGEIEIPANHPLFKSAELIQNESDYTLRLHLRKTGGFYGWHSYYNEQGQLCFQFLNPAKVTNANNLYGADLTGTKILIDVGHGGLDGGAEVYHCKTCNLTWTNTKKLTDKKYCPTCGQAVQRYIESELNLSLANALREELESMGATVVMNRYDDTGMDTDTRVEAMLETAPDFCIAVHQNSYADDTRVGGYDSMFFTPFSNMAAKKIQQTVKDTGVYAKTYTKWNVYFMARQAVCPVVLTENGYMTNPDDLNSMIDPTIVQTKAQAIARGIAQYFLEINK